MPTAGSFCNRRVVVAATTDRVLAAAALMRDEHVGDVILVEDREGRSVPVGILTDRDVVVGILARSPEYLSDLTVGDVVTRPLVTAVESEDIFEVLRRMRGAGVRRIPVIDAQGALAGVIALDDVLGFVADVLRDMSELTSRQIRRERSELRPPPA
jgi:CBS domain-containing protein